MDIQNRSTTSEQLQQQSASSPFNQTDAAFRDQPCPLPASKVALNSHPQGDTPPTATPVPSKTSTQSEPPSLNLSSVISRIISLPKSAPDQETVLTEVEIYILCDLAGRLFAKQPTLLELNPADSGITILGDTHGHLHDVLAVFKKEGPPDVHNYLFLGNYVGTGRHQIELVCLLLAYKLKYPENFFMVRGAHESRNTNSMDGFWHRCREMYGSEQIWGKFNQCFDAMPFAAVLGDRIFCVHSGISPHLQKLSQIRNVRKPTPVPNNGVLYDLLWASPTTTTPGWNTSPQNTVMVFGKGVWKDFFKLNELEFMIRSHGTLGPGFAMTEDKRILSIFSATDYEARENDAAFVHVSPDLRIQLYTFDANATFLEQRLERKGA